MAKQRKLTKYSPRAISGHIRYTKGGEFSLDGANYVGEYHDNGGIAYTGPTPTKLSKILTRYYVNPLHYDYERVNKFNVEVATFTNPTQHLYAPKNQSYELGFDNRYFVEKINDDQSFAIEISQAQYRSIGRRGGIDGGLYVHTSIRWKLTGTVTSITNHNQLELTKASYIVPSIIYGVKNFTEFGRITELGSPLNDAGIIPVVLDIPRREEVLLSIRNYYSNNISTTGSV